MANVNEVIDFDTAAIVATDLGFELEEETEEIEEVNTKVDEKIKWLEEHTEETKETLIEERDKFNTSIQEIMSKVFPENNSVDEID